MASFKKVGNVRGVLDKLEAAGILPEEILQAPDNALESAETELKRIYKEAHEVNSGWINGLFRAYRKGVDPYTDCFVVDGTGRNVFAGQYWTTFRDYYSYPDVPLPPSLRELLKTMADRKDLVYPLVPEENRFLFFLEKDFGRLRSIVDMYPLVCGNVEGEKVLRASAKFKPPLPQERDLLGPSALKPHGIAVGRIGFWDVNNRYLPRVRIYAHPASEDILISLMKEGLVHAYGGLPEDRKPGRWRCIRLEISGEVAKRYDDFIEAAFYTYLTDYRVSGPSLLLRYVTPEPVWKSQTCFLHK